MNPSRLISARSASSRKTRGRGLPGCGRGVTVPISTKPKPSRSSASGTRASLSNPAAMPIGFGKSRPQRCVRSTGGSAARCPSAEPRRERSQGQKMRRLGRQGPQQRRTERKKIGHLSGRDQFGPCRGPRPRPRRDRREPGTGSAPCCRSSRPCRPGAACRRRPACWRARPSALSGLPITSPPLPCPISRPLIVSRAVASRQIQAAPVGHRLAEHDTGVPDIAGDHRRRAQPLVVVPQIFEQFDRRHTLSTEFPTRSTSPPCGRSAPRRIAISVSIPSRQ